MLQKLIIVAVWLGLEVLSECLVSKVSTDINLAYILVLSTSLMQTVMWVWVTSVMNVRIFTIAYGYVASITDRSKLFRIVPDDDLFRSLDQLTNGFSNTMFHIVVSVLKSWILLSTTSGRALFPVIGVVMAVHVIIKLVTLRLELSMHKLYKTDGDTAKFAVANALAFGSLQEVGHFVTYATAQKRLFNFISSVQYIAPTIASVYFTRQGGLIGTRMTILCVWLSGAINHFFDLVSSITRVLKVASSIKTSDTQDVSELMTLLKNPMTMRLRGPKGSGKTSLLQSIYAAARCTVFYLPQASQTINNILLPIKIKEGLKWFVDVSGVSELKCRLEAHMIGTPIGPLSGGEQRLTELFFLVGSVIEWHMTSYNRRFIVLLDEPELNIDQKTYKEVLMILLSRLTALGGSVVVVSHCETDTDMGWGLEVPLPYYPETSVLVSEPLPSYNDADKDHWKTV